MTTVTPFPGKPTRRIVRKHDPMQHISGALQDLEEIAREHEHDPTGIMQAVARIRRALAEIQEP
ncbi:hypothetical protein ACIU1J_27575 [Azospirillum doebereinerae]|uniref:hypothetical protein n=1 Tax=Azospirillum doebereinerae TaxID=92933 RepID=UPI001EE52417|nr:hypothetical protein [Azospirillum doebereinerae]MCG5241381.1 hypothetical protein [Azospirillum doebereinerae]